MFKKSTPAPPAYLQTRWSIVEAQRRRFDAIEQLVQMAADGTVRALIVSGGAGTGKTHTTMRVMRSAKGVVKNRRLRLAVLKGYTRATGLYTLMHEYRGPHDRILIDDCDSALDTEDALNLLKAALDTTERREISWRSQGSLAYKNSDGVDVVAPPSFVFEGSVVFLTNRSFDGTGTTKLSPHLEALMSRAHYIDIGIKSDEQKLVRVLDVSHHAEILTKIGLRPQEQDSVYQFMEANLPRLREISLRMVDKLARLVRASPQHWQELATVSCLKQ